MLMPDDSVPEVALVLPRLRFRFQHGNNTGDQLVLSFVGAGVSSLDDPGSVEVSQFISMEPPYAYVGGATDRALGIGFRSATLDLDGDFTPPALRDKAGVGDDWTGLYLPEVRVFVAPDGLRNLAFECGAQELLIGLDTTTGGSGATSRPRSCSRAATTSGSSALRTRRQDVRRHARQVRRRQRATGDRARPAGLDPDRRRLGRAPTVPAHGGDQRPAAGPGGADTDRPRRRWHGDDRHRGAVRVDARRRRRPCTSRSRGWCQS